jgi:spore germination protein GerM
VQALLDGPTFDEFRDRHLQSAVPDTTELRGTTVAGSVATVDLTGDFDDGSDVAALRTRLAQLVFTVTAEPGIGSVRLRLDGASTAVFGASGIRTNRNLTRSDFADLAPT